MTEAPDRITEFYNRHPYPPPAADLNAYTILWADNLVFTAEALSGVEEVFGS